MACANPPLEIDFQAGKMKIYRASIGMSVRSVTAGQSGPAIHAVPTNAMPLPIRYIIGLICSIEDRRATVISSLFVALPKPITFHVIAKGKAIVKWVVDFTAARLARVES